MILIMCSLNGFTLIDFSDGLFSNRNRKKDLFSNSDEIQATENWEFKSSLC